MNNRPRKAWLIMRNKTKNGQICLKTFIALLMPFFVWGSTQATYYVDPINGKDTNLGTITQPFKSITKARDVVRRLTEA